MYVLYPKLLLDLSLLHIAPSAIPPDFAKNLAVVSKFSEQSKMTPEYLYLFTFARLLFPRVKSKSVWARLLVLKVIYPVLFLTITDL